MLKKFKKFLNKEIDLEKTGMLIAALLAITFLGSTPAYEYFHYTKPHTTAEFASTAVKITNMLENSGGTGVILESNADESIILTNKHVCKVVEHGGLVIQENSRYLVSSFRESNEHDLCEIKVNADLHINTKVADHSPKLYSEAFISGHPRLMPHVLTKGSFSSKLTIDVMIGMKPCTQETLDNAKKKGDIDTFISCLVLGGIPDIKTYQSQLVSATILPGSSGSAVFNGDGEIAGVAFASSSRELSYAYIVPQEFVYAFTHREAKTLAWSQPAQQ